MMVRTLRDFRATVTAASRSRPAALLRDSGTAVLSRSQVVKFGLVAVWLGLVVLQVAGHVYWRDEVRALSLALGGSDVAAMLGGVRGEGHPAIWYLLLRGVHAIVGGPVALPIVSVTVAAAAIFILVRHSPFAAWVIALILLGRFVVYEYSVMARNYGISLLVMFALAAAYPRCRDRGLVLGGLLFLLANTNVHSVMLAGAFLLFWMIDLMIVHGVRWTPPLRNFAINAAIAGLGIGLCCVTVFPPFNDAAVINLRTLTVDSLLKALFLPSSAFPHIIAFRPYDVDRPLLVKLLELSATSAVLIGSMTGLVRRPAAMAAGLAAIVGFSLFFAVIYPGMFRHQALLLGFFIMLYWIVLAGDDTLPPRFDRIARPLSTIGATCFVVLLTLQAAGGAVALIRLPGDPPHGRARDFADFVRSRPEYRDAVILASPDYMLESLPYYLPNRTYFVHEQRFGRVVKFTLKARLAVTLDDIVATATRLHATTGAPVLVLVARATEILDPSKPAQAYRDGYQWTLQTTPGQVARFGRAMRVVAEFPPARSTESYTAFALANP